MQPVRLEKDREFQEETKWKENKTDRLSGMCFFLTFTENN